MSTKAKYFWGTISREEAKEELNKYQIRRVETARWKVLIVLIVITIGALLYREYAPISKERVEKFCELNDFSEALVLAVEMEDNSVINRHDLIELYRYTTMYDDTYAALMIHRYGYLKAKKKTDNFENYIEDDYSFNVWESQKEIQKILDNKATENGGK